MNVVHNVQALERRGRYGMALALAEAGIRAIHSDGVLYSGRKKAYIELLGARVRHSVKFCRWREALEDLDEIICLAPQNGRARVLKAQVYVKSGQYIDAMRMCKDSASIVGRRSRHWVALKKEWCLARASSRGRYVDPLTVLPKELMIKILHGIIKTTSNIVTVMLVSKRWYSFLVNTPLLWSKLYFQSSTRYVPYHIIDRFCIKSKGVPLHMRISPRVQRPQRFLRKLAHYSNLVSLIIDNSSVLLEDLVRAGTALHNMTSLRIFSKDIGKSLPWTLGHMAKLESLNITASAPYVPSISVNTDFEVISPLKSISIAGPISECLNIDPRLTTKVFGDCRQTLQTINLHGVRPDLIRTTMQTLSSLTLTEFGLTAFGSITHSPPWNVVIKPPLKKLTLGNMIVSLDHDSHSIIPSLEHITLNSCFMPSLTVGHVLKHLNYANNMRILEINGTDLNLSWLFDHPSDKASFRSIRRFALKAIPGAIPSHRFIEQIGDAMPNLVFADFTGTTLNNALITVIIEHRIKVVKCRSCCRISETNLTLALKLGVKLI